VTNKRVFQTSSTARPSNCGLTKGYLRACTAWGKKRGERPTYSRTRTHRPSGTMSSRTSGSLRGLSHSYANSITFVTPALACHVDHARWTSATSRRLEGRRVE